jgi:hypothetical protein
VDESVQEQGTRPTPYGIRRPPRRVEPPEGQPGTELVPGGEEKSMEFPAGPDMDSPVTTLDASRPPIVVGLEPTVVSLAEGEEITLQLVVRDAPGSYRMPIGLSFNSERVAIDSFEPAPGVQILEGSLDEDSGWLSLDLMVLEGSEAAQGVAAFRVRALTPGPAPLVFTSGGAIADDGSAVPVAASDGALYVVPGTVSRGP